MAAGASSEHHRRPEVGLRLGHGVMVVDRPPRGLGKMEDRRRRGVPASSRRARRSRASGAPGRSSRTPPPPARSTPAAASTRSSAARGRTAPRGPRAWASARTRRRSGGRGAAASSRSCGRRRSTGTVPPVHATSCHARRSAGSSGSSRSTRHSTASMTANRSSHVAVPCSRSHSSVPTGPATSAELERRVPQRRRGQAEQRAAAGRRQLDRDALLVAVVRDEHVRRLQPGQHAAVACRAPARRRSARSRRSRGRC